MNKEISLYTDGGSRGNPGKGGIGVYLEIDGKPKKYFQKLPGKVTNNEAEYEALIFGIKKVVQLVGKKNLASCRLRCNSDSELMVKQLNHQYKLINPGIIERFVIIWNLTVKFGKVEYVHIPREKNKIADGLANKAMDQDTLF